MAPLGIVVAFACTRPVAVQATLATGLFDQRNSLVT